ncbi:MAG TPA: DNA-directed RNA polymerase subunit B'' [Methanothermococcus okinawensis]|uniref:DNA-directed RNA polymerase n=3 Tax=Methanothermococcus okinawensis TaxID=155863 RepID=A0A832ZJW8_9EURY|nr:DNA-directed RNA polymerase subunit B'' [Methanothermococcus okinawensis]
METQTIVDSFFKENSLVKHQIDSFNRFLDYKLQKIVDEVGVIETEIKGGYKVKLGKIRVGKPINKEADGSIRKITPMEARIRDLSYSAPLYLEMTPVIGGEGEEEIEGETVEVYIGELPIMLGSKACYLHGKSREELIEMGEDPRDPLGYFIINGSERVLVTQEDLVQNRILCEKTERNNKTIYGAKVFSTRHGFRALCTVERQEDGKLNVTFPGLSGSIPLVILMKALGAESDSDIINMISDDQQVIMQLITNILEVREEYNIATQEDALEYIGKKVAPGQPRDYRLKRAETILCNYLLPHMGVKKEDFIKKCAFLGRMARNAIELYLGLRVEDDKDHYGNKRLKPAGELMEDLFRYSFNQLVKDIKYQLERQVLRNKSPSIQSAVRSDVLTERIRHAMATGNWIGGRTGVSQLLDRTSYLSTLSQLRRVVSPLSRSQPHFEARDLHPTQWGKICPSETPEGPNCGLVKNLAIMSKITTDDKEGEKKVLEALKEVPINPVKEFLTTPNS